MVVWQGRSSRKKTGGRIRKLRSKRKFEYGKEPAHTKIAAEVKVKKVRTQGGGRKLRILNAKIINVFHNKKMVKAEMKTVEENTANRHFKRSNILTKGALVNTSIGLVKVTNRPGQDGQIQGIFVK